MDGALPNAGAVLADPVTLTAGAVLLVFVFVTAALHKLREPEVFGSALAAYGLVPPQWQPLLARALPVLEGCTALLLALLPFGAANAAGFALSATLLAGYGAAMAVNLLRGRRTLDCGCGGAPQRIGWPLVVRNLLLAALAAGWARASAGGPSRPLEAIDVVGVVGAGLGFILAWLAADELLRQWARMNELRAADGHAHD